MIYTLTLRPDECEAPPNFKELADKTPYGLNVNGSVCLNNICMCVRLRIVRPLEVLTSSRWANATLGNNCTVENTAYTVYASSNESLDIVSRYVSQPPQPSIHLSVLAGITAPRASTVIRQPRSVCRGRLSVRLAMPIKSASVGSVRVHARIDIGCP